MGGVLLFLIGAGIVLSGPIAFIFFFVLRSRISELENRITELKDEVRRLSSTQPGVRAVFSAKAEFSQTAPSPVEPPKKEAPLFVATPVAPEKPNFTEQPAPSAQSVVPLAEPLAPAAEPTISPGQAAAATAQPTASPELTPAAPRISGDAEWEKTHAPAQVGGEFSWQSLELLIGRKILGWVAVVGFVLAAAFFIRYANQQGWIGPAVKVFGIAAFGAVFLAAGKYFSNLGWRRFSTMLSSAGIIIIFQAGYASYGFYQLISLSTAGIVMSLIVCGSFLLSWYYESRLLGVISILGGLAVPMLLSSEVDRYPEFFTYLAILNLGVVLLVNLLNRAPLGLIAFLGTQAEFWLWYDRYYEHPEKLAAVLAFQSAFYAIYLIDTTLAAMLPRQKATWDDAVRAILAPILFFGTIWILLNDDPTFGNWLGIFAFAGAAWYALLAVLYARHLKRLWNAEAERQLSIYWKAGPSAATVIALGFVAIGIPLHFEATWFALGWATVFAGLWYFGFRQENRAFFAMSCLFALLATVRLLYDIFRTRPIADGELLTPLFNMFALPSFAAAVVVIGVAVLTDRLLRKKPDDTPPLFNVDGFDRDSVRNANCWLGLAGYVFLAMLLSYESVQFFDLRSETYALSAYWASLSLTVLWGLLALVLLEVGVGFRSLMLRNAGFVGFLIVAVKIVLFDFALRSELQTPLTNPFCPGLVGMSLLLIAVGLQVYRCKPYAEGERNRWGSLGIVGIFTLLGILSVECFQYFFRYDVLRIPLENLDRESKRLIALGTLSVLWTIYGLGLLGLGLRFRSLPLRVCGFVVLIGTLLKIAALELLRRPDYTLAFCNPYFLTMLVPALGIIGLAVGTVRLRPLADKRERDFAAGFGLAGLGLFWVILSVECFAHFDKNPLPLGPGTDAARDFIASASLSLLWTVFAGTVIVIGLLGRSNWLRVFGLVVFGTCVLKILGFELFCRPGFTEPLLNPYFLSISIPAAVMIAVSIWTNRTRPLENVRERTGFLAFGLCAVGLLWGSLSFECFDYFDLRTDWPNSRFLASTSLTVFWTALGVGVVFLAARARSPILRILAVGFLGIAFLKAVAFDLFQRPSYTTPFFNPYALPLVLLAAALIFAGVVLASLIKVEKPQERTAYRIIAFAGVVFLWLVLSLECFDAVRLLQSAEEEAWKAQMSLSILWSVFAGALICIGFVWRSAILRWMSILLFAATSTKVLIVDMAGVHELYRFGAIFVLAIFLTLAAWAYQRFKPA